MAERPTPILALDPGTLSREEAFRALALGALDVVERPASPGPDFWHASGAPADGAGAGAGGAPCPGQAQAAGGPGGARGALPPGGHRRVAGRPQGDVPGAADDPRRLPGAGVPSASTSATASPRGWRTGCRSETALRVLEATHEQLDGAGHGVHRSVGSAPAGAAGRAGWCWTTRPPVRGFRPSCDLLLSSAARGLRAPVHRRHPHGHGARRGAGVEGDPRARGEDHRSERGDVCRLRNASRGGAAGRRARRSCRWIGSDRRSLEWVETC